MTSLRLFSASINPCQLHNILFQFLSSKKDDATRRSSLPLRFCVLGSPGLRRSKNEVFLSVPPSNSSLCQTDRTPVVVASLACYCQPRSFLLVGYSRSIDSPRPRSPVDAISRLFLPSLNLREGFLVESPSARYRNIDFFTQRS